MFSDRNANARVGEVIADRFRLEKLIGVGAMGAVYRGVHEWTQRKVAVKLLFDDSNPAEAIERFFREARAATRIGHRNIVEVLDMGQHSDGTYFLAQELLEGETLRQRLDRLHKLSLTETLELMLPVMDALTAAHAAGIVHRDVKPENIILHSERKTSRAAKVVPKLIDFGVAKSDNHPVRLTAAGVVLGTPNYMAPEQVEGALDVGPQADLWSLGVILYECLGGERPFSAPTIRELFTQICTSAPRPLKSLAPALSDELAVVVHTALERDRSQRFASVHAMLAALSSIAPRDESPALAAMLESFAAPIVPRSATDARAAFKPAVAMTPPAVKTPTPQSPTVRASRSNASDGASARRPARSTNRAQLAMGVGLGVAIAAFGAFTIRGGARSSTPTNSTPPALATRPDAAITHPAITATNSAPAPTDTRPAVDAVTLDASVLDEPRVQRSPVQRRPTSSATRSAPGSATSATGPASPGRIIE
ncbi:MAG: protein kinase [Polyangiales bacterium]